MIKGRICGRFSLSTAGGWFSGPNLAQLLLFRARLKGRLFLPAVRFMGRLGHLARYELETHEGSCVRKTHV